MLVKIVQSGGPGTIYQPGSLIRVPNKRAEYLIRAGFAEAAGPADEVPRRTRREVAPRGPVPVKAPKPSRHMLPPRYIAPDGRVFKNQKELDKYVKDNP